jgi:hypothetical protein
MCALLSVSGGNDSQQSGLVVSIRVQGWRMEARGASTCLRILPGHAQFPGCMQSVQGPGCSGSRRKGWTVDF